MRLAHQLLALEIASVSSETKRVQQRDYVGQMEALVRQWSGAPSQAVLAGR